MEVRMILESSTTELCYSRMCAGEENAKRVIKVMNTKTRHTEGFRATKIHRSDDANTTNSMRQEIYQLDSPT